MFSFLLRNTVMIFRCDISNIISKKDNSFFIFIKSFFLCEKKEGNVFIFFTQDLFSNLRPPPTYPEYCLTCYFIAYSISQKWSHLIRLIDWFLLHVKPSKVILCQEVDVSHLYLHFMQPFLKIFFSIQFYRKWIFFKQIALTHRYDPHIY